MTNKAPMTILPPGGPDHSEEHAARKAFGCDEEYYAEPEPFVAAGTIKPCPDAERRIVSAVDDARSV